jgi:ribosomal protein S18 acetylase RimI-like enzyme
MRIRKVTAADVPFLERMMLLAGFPPDGPLPSDARSMPHVRRFVEAWGRGGDVGVVALDGTGRRLGAAWARLLEDPLLVDRVGVPVAEVAIAVESRARGRGAGTSLLRALEHAAAAAGHRELSLTVSSRNPAVRLYERAGYERVRDVELVGEGEREGGVVMRRRLR